MTVLRPKSDTLMDNNASAEIFTRAMLRASEKGEVSAAAISKAGAPDTTRFAKFCAPSTQHTIHVLDANRAAPLIREMNVTKQTVDNWRASGRVNWFIYDLDKTISGAELVRDVRKRAIDEGKLAEASRGPLEEAMRLCEIPVIKGEPLFDAHRRFARLRPQFEKTLSPKEKLEHNRALFPTLSRFFAGMHQDELAAITDQVIADTISPHVYEGIVETAEALAEKNITPFIVSASTDFLVKRLAKFFREKTGTTAFEEQNALGMPLDLNASGYFENRLAEGKAPTYDDGKAKAVQLEAKTRYGIDDAKVVGSAADKPFSTDRALFGPELDPLIRFIVRPASEEEFKVMVYWAEKLDLPCVVLDPKQYVSGRETKPIDYASLLAGFGAAMHR
ncbi:MAG: haloacid dehalogenase-like hydrolase [Myxococcota bacterium]